MNDNQAGTKRESVNNVQRAELTDIINKMKQGNPPATEGEIAKVIEDYKAKNATTSEGAGIEIGSYDDDLDMSNTKTIIDKSEGQVVDAYLDSPDHPGLAVEKAGFMFGDAVNFVRPDGSRIYVDLQNDLENEQKKLDELNAWYGENEEKASLGLWGTLGAANKGNLVKEDASVMRKPIEDVNTSLSKMYSEGGNNYRVVTNMRQSLRGEKAGAMKVNSYKLTSDTGDDIEFEEWGDLQKYLWDNVTEEELGMLREADLDEADAVIKEGKEVEAKKYEDLTDGDAMEELVSNGGIRNMLDSKAKELNLSEEDQALFDKRLAYDDKIAKEWESTWDPFGLQGSTVEDRFKMLHDSVYNTKFGGDKYSEDGAEKVKSLFRALDLPSYDQTKLNKVKSQMADDFGSKWVQTKLKSHPNYRGIQAALDAETSSENMKPQFQAHKDRFENLERSAKADVKKIDAQTNSILSSISGLRDNGSDIGYATKEINGKHIITVTGGDKELVRQYQDRVNKQQRLYNNVLGEYSKEHANVVDKYDAWRAGAEDYAKVAGISNRELDTFTLMGEDLLGGFEQMALGMPAAFGSEAAMDGLDALQAERESLAMDLGYDEALKLGLGETGSYIGRSISKQTANVVVAVALSSLKMPKLATEIAVGSTFGLASGGQKRQQLRTASDMAEQAKLDIVELKALKGSMNPEDYHEQLAELEKIKKVGDLTRGQIEGIVWGTAMIEGVVTAKLGTLPNAKAMVKAFGGKGVGVNPFMTGNQRFGDFLWKFGKSVGGEVVEEEIILFGSEILEGTINWEHDISFAEWDETLVQAVLLAGPMNGPSGAYSSVTQHMAGEEFREEFDDVIKIKDRLDRELRDPNLTDEKREKISAEYWDNLARIGVAQSGLEVDAMVTGVDGLRELASTALSLRSLYTAADIKYTDSDETKKKKIADHVAELSKKSKAEGQSFQDRYDRAIREKAKIHDATQAKYDEKSALDEDGLIKHVYGAKGLEMALEMAEKDPKFKKLPDRDKLVVLHEKIKKEFHDGQVAEAKRNPKVREMIEGIVYNEVDEDGNKLEGGKEGYFKRNGKSRRTSEQVKREQQLYEMWAVHQRSSQVEAMTLDKDVTLNAPPSLTEADIKSFDDILDSKGKVEKTALQQLEDFINKQDKSDSDKKEIIDGFRKGDVNGVIINGKYIVLDAAQARKNLANGELLQATAIFHEYSHFLDNVTMKEGEMDQMAENLNESLESDPILKRLHDAVVYRGSNILDSEGNPEYNTELPFKKQSRRAKEEYVKYAEEMLLQNKFWKQLNAAKKAGGGIANTLRGFTGGDFNFTSKGAALHYIVEYGQSWLRGEDSKLVERKKKAFASTPNEKSTEVEDKFSRARIKKVTKVSAEETVYEAVNKLAEGVKTNAEWVKRENIDKAVEALKPGGAISNLVRDPVRGMTAKEQNLTIQELRVRLKNFNPEAKRKTGSDETITFIEFVNSNIRFGRLDARLELAIAGAETKLTKSLDATTSEGKQAFEIEAETDVNVQAFEEQDMSMQAQSRRAKLAEQGKSESDQYSAFRNELGLDEAMMDKIRKAVVKTFGTKLPNINSKKFRAALEKAYRTELKKPIQDMMGKGDAYNEFLDKTFPIVYRFLTKESLVQMERLVGGKKDKENGYTNAQRIFTTQRRVTKSAEVDKLIEEGKLPKDTSRVSGPNLIEKLPYPGKEKILAYFRGVNSLELLGYEREPSDFGTRKDRVAEQMGVELGFDATMETVQDPEVNKRRESILELTGQAQAANDLAVIAKQIDRDPNIKFSIKLDKAVEFEKNALHKIALLSSSLEVAPFSMVDSKEIQTVGRLISEVGAHAFLKRTQELANNILAPLVPIENDPKNQKAKDDFSRGAIRGAIIATYGDVFNAKDLERLTHAIHAVATSNKLPKTAGEKKIAALKIQLDKLITDNDSKTALWFGTGKTTMSLMSDPKKIALRRAETVDFMIKEADRINEDSASLEEAGLRIMRSMNMLRQQMSTAAKIGGKRAQYFLAKDFLETMNKNIPGLSFSIKEDGAGFKVDFSKPVTYKGKVLNIKESDLALDAQSAVGVIKEHISDILTGTTKVKDREAGVREAREHLNNYVAYYVGLYEAGIIGKEDLQMAAANLLSNMSPSLARAAMPKFIAEDMLPPNWESMSKQELNRWITQNLKGDLKPVFEHMQPRLLVVLGLFEAHLFNGGVTDVDAHFANYDVAIISDRMDKALKAAGLNNSLAEGQTLSMESWIRYYNAVALATGKMKSLFGIGSNDGISVGKGHQLASEILKERLEGLEQAARANGLLAFSKSPASRSNAKKLIDGLAENDISDAVSGINPDEYSNIRFSKSHRAEYEKRLLKNNADIGTAKQAAAHIDALFNWVDSSEVPVKKKSKFEKLALHYMVNNKLRMPEDGYKVIEAERLAEAKKIDPFSFKNPNEIIERYAGEVTKKNPNPDQHLKENDSIGAFSNKREIGNGITVYDVENSSPGMLAVRNMVNEHFGKKSNPWCITQAIDGKLTDTASEYWDQYGTKQILFKDGKLLAMRTESIEGPLTDAGDIEFWSRDNVKFNEVPGNDYVDEQGREIRSSFNEKTGKDSGIIYGATKGSIESGKIEIYDTWIEGAEARWKARFKETGIKPQLYLEQVERYNKKGQLHGTQEQHISPAEMETGSYASSITLTKEYENGDFIGSRTDYGDGQGLGSFQEKLRAQHGDVMFSKSSKGITVLDFDDTLATTKSGVKARIPNPDGTPKPGRKVIFMAGGAGSGKGNVIRKLGLEEAGYKIVNSDISLEWLKKNHGLPENQSDYTAEQRSQLSKLSAEARKIAKRKQGKFAGNGDGVVVDGTGGSIKMMEKLVEEFKAKGYDVSMIFVETSLEVAQQRNADRKERSLREGILNKNHEQVQGNKEAFKALFGETFNEVSTDKIGLNDALPGDFKDKVDDFTNSYENRRLDAEEFAKEGGDIKANGGEFDFSEFNQVIEGEIAPMFNKAMKLSGKFGTDNMFILTARSPEAAPAIKEFLDAQGLNIPLKNITGLGQSEASAKANWIAEKVGEGYNNFYFADDAIQNVEAVKDMLDQFDVKGKVQQAKLKFSKSAPRKMSEIIDEGAMDLNTILEQTKGVDRKKVFSAAKARKRGKNKGKFKFFVPPSADDFAGLMYAFMGKGKQGEQHHQFFKENLFDPFSKGIRRLNQVKQAAANDLRGLRKAMPEVRKKLDKIIPGTEYTYEDAIRVYNWVQAGFEVAGLSETDKQTLVDTVTSDASLSAFAQGINAISSTPGGIVDPGADWMGGNIALDLKEALDVARGTYLQQWKENVDIIFNEANLNKIEAVYGSNFREALEDSLWRMEYGGNRSRGAGRLLANFTNWIHGSIGTTMFLNARSAMLQMISNVNFVNWSDNNMIAAAKAFGNQPQYWKDVAMIFNSPFLKQRRSGIQTDVNAAELLAQIKDSKNQVKAATAYLLQLGFTPTQIADSFAIATGGATFYRNRIKTYLKEGMAQAEAETKAFNDMMEIAEETQQSTREDKISQQQASPLGKFVLAFQNTPMQYNRLIKKAALDLVNGRGDPKANISRIVYYGGIQNLIFYGLQSALFAALFSDDEEDQTTDKKKERVVNGMLDTLLRGSGIGGAIVATVKNVILKFMKESEKMDDGIYYTDPDWGNVVIEALNISPPIGIKARKIYSGLKTWEYNKDVIDHMDKTDMDNPIYDAAFSVTEAVTNLPLSRLYNKVQNISEALNSDNETWQRVAMFLGWSKWSFGIKNQDVVTAKGEAKIIKAEEKKKEARESFIKDQKEERGKGKKDIKCAASTKSGSRCGKAVLSGGNYCTIHVEVATRSDGKKTQCSHVKSDGKRCKMQTASQSGKCYYHD